MQHAEHYFNGDACKWTGAAEEHHNGLFYVYEILEGHRKGETIVSQQKPNIEKVQA